MKTALLFFLIGLAAGVIGMGLYVERGDPSPPSLGQQVQDAAAQAAEKTKTTAGTFKDTLASKLEDWHLTGDDIRDDLAKTGHVVRQKADAAGDTISDTRILTVIKAKFVLDRDLPALAINVDAAHGKVVLKGTLDSADLIGKAVGLALDTDGVRTVTSNLKVEAN